MNLHRLNSADLVGVIGLGSSWTLGDTLGALAALVTIAAMAPLAFWRWRAVLRGDPKPEPAKEE